MLGFTDWLNQTGGEPEDNGEGVKESRPYTRSLRYYPSITAPTGGGPNFQYISQDGLASANAKAQGMGKDGKSKPATVPAEPPKGMEDSAIKKRLAAWAKWSGVKT